MYDIRTVYFWGYFAISLGGALLALQHLNAHSQNVYTIGIAASEGLPLLVFGNLVIALVMGVGKLALSISFGELRLIEVEHIHERAWPTLMGLGMSAAVYSRHENTLHLLVLVLGLVVMKVFTWITIDRLNMLIQKYQMDPRGSIRGTVLSSPVLIALLLLRVDYAVVSVFVDEAIGEKHELLLVMAFEYFLVALGLTRSTMKFFINVRELMYVRNHPEEEIWEKKSMLLAVVDVVLGLVNAILTPTIFIMFVTMGVIPLNLTWEIFNSFLELSRAVSMILKLQKTKRELMNSVVEPDLSDLEREDLCIICRDEMVIGGIAGNKRSIPKKIACGHVLHIGCLKSWLERSNGCPVCRKPVIATSKTSEPDVEVEPVPGQVVEAAEEQQQQQQPVPGPEVEEPVAQQPVQEPTEEETHESNELDQLLNEFDNVVLPERVRKMIKGVKEEQKRSVPSNIPKDWTSIDVTHGLVDFNGDSQVKMASIERKL